MTRRDVTAQSIQYTIASDDPARLELKPWAVLRTRVLDELTGEPPRVALRLVTDMAQATPRATEDGLCGLVARPRDVSSALLGPGRFAARIEARGYLTRDLGTAIAAAQRALQAAALQNDTALQIAPPDPTPPRVQFQPGRGVWLERPASAQPDEFLTVDVTAVPPAANVVPVTPSVATGHPLASRVSGVPLVLPDQPLHRSQPIRLRGQLLRRVVGRGPPILQPAIGASIGIRGVWWTMQAANTQAPLPAPLDFCSIAPTLAFDHAVGAPVQTCGFNNVGAALRTGEVAEVGARELVLRTSTALNPLGGELLRVGNPLSGEFEVVVSAGFLPPSSALIPVRMRLTAPTRYLYRADTEVQRVAAVGLANLGNVTREAQRGDSVLFTSGLAGAAGSLTLAVEHGTARAAYYRATQLPATPPPVPPNAAPQFNFQIPVDNEGRFQWPPIGRIARVRIVAQHPLHTALQQVDFAFDYSGDNTLAIIFT